MNNEKLFELVEKHFGLSKRNGETVIDRRTGTFHDIARYRGFAKAVLREAAAQESLATKEKNETASSARCD